MVNAAFSGLHFFKAASIYAFLFVLFLLNLVDLPLLGPMTGRQAVILIGLYFFIIFRPRIMPYWLIFVIGLALDLISGGIVGLNALCFMLLAITLRGQRRFLLGQTWQVLWAGFCVATALIICFQSLAYGLISMQFFSVAPVALNIIISSFLYPLLLPVMIALNRWQAA